MMQNSDVKKKKYLKQYIPCVMSVREIERTLTSLENELKAFLSHVDIRLLIEYFEKINQVKKLLLQARYRKWFTYLEVYKCIEKLEDETEKRVLRLKYLEGYSWDQVADDMGYSVRQIHNIHKKALGNLKI